MNTKDFKKLREERVQDAYSAVPNWFKEDLYAAVNWAKETLTNQEGNGHIFDIVAAPAVNEICCVFSKPSWPGDHCGRGMSTGAEAVVMAVCEYLNGV